MKAKFIKYVDGEVIHIIWENEFEESVINSIFGDGSVLARKYGNCIQLDKMDEKLEKIIYKYFKKKEKEESETPKNKK